MSTQIRKTELLEDAKSLFYSRLHCSETVLQAFNKHLGLELNDAAIKMATAFGGGFGNAKCSCGALTGAEMVVSALKGRTSPEEDCIEVAQLAKELHTRFVAKFGCACCRVLTKDIEWGTMDHLGHCGEITLGTVEILADILIEHERKAVA